MKVIGGKPALYVGFGVLLSVVLACSFLAQPTPVPPTATAVPPTATAIPPTATPVPPTEIPAPPPGACETADSDGRPVEQVFIGETYDRFQPQAAQYPATCSMYCVWVPDGGSSLNIGIRNFDVDLDIYVDRNLSVLAYSDHGMWESNAYGTGDETVYISSPDSGAYYMQVCSYTGAAGSYELWNSSQ